MKLSSTTGASIIGITSPARILTLTSLGLWLLSFGPPNAQGHMMMVASPFNGLGRGDR